MLYLNPYSLFYRRRHMVNSENQVPHPTPEAEEIYRRWIRFLDEEFLRHCSFERRSEIVRDQLYQLYMGRPHGGKLNLTLTSELPGNVRQSVARPGKCDPGSRALRRRRKQRWRRRKPLLWFWQMFDRSPIGLNHWLGLRFRCMLGRHIFARMGTGVKIYHGVDLTYGYNLSIGDGVDHPSARPAQRPRRHHHRQQRHHRLLLSHFFPLPRSRRTTQGALEPTVIGAGARV